MSCVVRVRVRVRLGLGLGSGLGVGLGLELRLGLGLGLRLGLGLGLGLHRLGGHEQHPLAHVPRTRAADGALLEPTVGSARVVGVGGEVAGHAWIGLGLRVRVRVGVSAGGRVKAGISGQGLGLEVAGHARAGRREVRAAREGSRVLPVT